MSQIDFEHELLAYVAQLTPEHGATIAQIHAEHGPRGVIAALEQTGLSAGALQVAEQTLTGLGYQGSVERVQGRLQEVATHNQIEHAATDPRWQDYAAKWLNENGVKPDGQSPVHQAGRILVAAQTHGVNPTELARHVARTQDPAEQLAQEAREKPVAGDRMQALLEQPDLHRAALARGVTGRAFVAELVKMADPSSAVRRALDEGGDLAKASKGLFTDAAQARELLGHIDSIDGSDKLAARVGAKDGPALKEAPEDSWRAELGKQLDKVTASAPRGPQAPRPGSTEIVDTDSWRHELDLSWRRANGEGYDGLDPGPKVRARKARDASAIVKEANRAGDDWRSHLSKSWDRIEARDTGGESAVAAFDQRSESLSKMANDFEAEAEEAEAAS